MGGRDHQHDVLDIAVIVDQFPELSETFIVNEASALRRAGHDVRIEARTRADRPNWTDAAGLEVRFADEERRRDRLRDLLWLLVHRPAGVLGDLGARRRWAREEDVPPLRVLASRARRLARRPEVHLHAHFAAGAALDALRLAALLGRPYSVTAHGYDIYQAPRNLREKLVRASFATSGCAYTVADLRAIAGSPHAERVHEIVMGVDGDDFARRTPYPGTRHVVAVGRLVAKKGFADLVAAAARLRDGGAVERVTIVGEGPLRRALEREIAVRGLADIVDLAGALEPVAVRAVLETADVLCAPCVVAPDGDRDSMPVVVKEAMAMEVPVVASDEVGLPEVVRPPWGVLVPPADPEALAGALADVLGRPAPERAAMGRAGRAHVLAACDVDVEAAKLVHLVQRALRDAGSRGGQPL